MSCGEFSDITVVGIAKFCIQWSEELVAVLAAVVQAISIALAGFEYRSAVTTMSRLPNFVFSHGSSIFMAMYSTVLEGGSKRCFPFLLLARPFSGTPSKYPDSVWTFFYVQPIESSAHGVVHSMSFRMFSQQ